MTRTIVYGVFKGMGDLLAAAPVFSAELRAGSNVVLLVFPQIAEFPRLLDFDAMPGRLQVLRISLGRDLRSLLRFFREASVIEPELVWLSPHAPGSARSWKVPLAVWAVKRVLWRKAVLAGVRSERFSWLFDSRVPVDRGLPFTRREQCAYGALPGKEFVSRLADVRFRRLDPLSTGNDARYDLLIFPDAGAANRKWPLSNYEELLRLLPAGLRIGICAVRADADVLRSVIPEGRRIDLLQVPLAEAISLIGRTRVVFCMDSGPMFFSRVVGVPVVAMFGASDPANVIGDDNGVKPVFQKRWECQPCGSPRCVQRVPYCISRIDAETVSALICRALGEQGVECDRQG